jgi:microcystin-dependent protein
MSVETKKLTELGVAGNGSFKLAVQQLDSGAYKWKQMDSSELFAQLDEQGTIGEIKEVAFNDISGLTRWLPADGSLLNVSEYPDLFAVFSNRFGGDGVNNFALPDIADDIEVDGDTQVLVFWKEHATSATRNVTVSDPKQTYAQVTIAIPSLQLEGGKTFEFSGLTGSLVFLNGLQLTTDANGVLSVSGETCATNGIDDETSATGQTAKLRDVNSGVTTTVEDTGYQTLGDATNITISGDGNTATITATFDLTVGEKYKFIGLTDPQLTSLNGQELTALSINTLDVSQYSEFTGSFDDTYSMEEYYDNTTSTTTYTEFDVTDLTVDDPTYILDSVIEVDGLSFTEGQMYRLKGLSGTLLPIDEYGLQCSEADKLFIKGSLLDDVGITDAVSGNQTVSVDLFDPDAPSQDFKATVKTIICVK